MHVFFKTGRLMDVDFWELEKIVEILKPLSECPQLALGSPKKHFTHVRVQPSYKKEGGLDFYLTFSNPGECMSICRRYTEEDVRNLNLNSEKQ